MAERSTDRRVRKTRASLRSCLEELLETRTVKEISVKEISALADINRGTFYLHYKDVYDLLNSIEDELFTEYEQILKRYRPEEGEKGLRDFFTEFFRMLAENAALVRVLLGPNGDGRFRYVLDNGLREKVMRPYVRLYTNHSEEAFGYYYSFFAGGCIDMIRHWLDVGIKASPELLAERLSRRMALLAEYTVQSQKEQDALNARDKRPE